MATHTEIDALIRLRLRTIRLSRELGMRQVARRAGIPVSTYSAIENGHTQSVKAAKLFQILEAMGADASDVWPYANLSEILEIERARDLRHQEYRIHELADLMGARSAALLAVENGRAWVILAARLSPETGLRLAYHLESGGLPGGETYRHESGKLAFFLVIDEPSRDFGRALVDFFLERFGQAFAEDKLLLQTAKERHLQT